MFVLPKRIKKYVLGNIQKKNEYLKKRIRNLESFQESIINQMKYTIETLGNIKFHAQIEQDLLVYLYFKGKRDGFYIDIGANDGSTISNTMVFEKIGWGGVCVEPLPDTFKELRKNRSCDCFNVAISDTNNDSVEFLKAVGAETLSCLSDQVTQGHKNKVQQFNGKFEKIQVKTLTFDSLMNNYPGKYNVDFLSIDVEGAELLILKSINFSKYKFGFITVEYSVETKEYIKKLTDYMAEQGYKIYLIWKWDMMFVPIDGE